MGNPSLLGHSFESFELNHYIHPNDIIHYTHGTQDPPTLAQPTLIKVLRSPGFG